MVYDRESDEIYWNLIQKYIWEEYGRDPSSWQDQQTVTIRLERIPLSESREELIEVAKEAERPIYKYVFEEAVMKFMLGSAPRTEIRRAIREGESQSIEFKRDNLYSINLKEVAAGMSNSGGGTIVFGVNESMYGSRPEISGVEDPDSTVSHIQRDLSQVQPEINPEIRVELVDNAAVVVVEIPSYQDLPHAVDGRFYIRREATTEHMGPDELKDFFR